MLYKCIINKLNMRRSILYMKVKTTFEFVQNNSYRLTEIHYTFQKNKFNYIFFFRKIKEPRCYDAATHGADR